MTKQEFLDSLRMALTGRVSAPTVEENIRYYTDYINTQVRMGESEEDVLAGLGEPRLLAKSIVDADRRMGKEPVDEEVESKETVHDTGSQRRTRMSVWLVLGSVVLILILLLSIIFSVLAFLAPILLPIALCLFLVRVFWNKPKR
ncbi:MAG: DUF1700 domain-containing protein [Lachnospiraceae bacterium]|nr:DUF1700 domain-containing protein [Lachnospiraceae bacterium]